MATTTSTIHAAMNAFVDGMLARPNIINAGVQVTSGFLGADQARHESIQLFEVQGAEQSWDMLGNRRRHEEYTITGGIGVRRAGKNEDVIRDVRARAFELLGEIEDFLRVDPTIGGVTRVSELSRYPVQQGADAEGRWCQIDFEISCKKDLRS